MRLAHVSRSSSEPPRLAAVVDNAAFFLDELLGDAAPRTLQHLIDGGASLQAMVRDAVAKADSAELGVTAASLKFASAILEPPIVLAVGLNYDEHASELHLENDSGPVLFALFPNSLTGHDCNVQLPTNLSQEIDYEGELGVIIGKTAKNVTEAEALNHVYGYTVVNDITARDLQFREPQWSRCKSFDTFTPNGPFVVTADEIADPQNLHITTDVDGLRVQDSTTGNMIRSVAKIISSISQSLTLLPGTLISTGSPGGAGRSRKPPLFLKPGTEVTVTIEGIGALTSHCVKGS